MADAFETRLAAMFDDAPEMPGASDFLIGLEAKIDRARAERRTAALIVVGAAAFAAAAALGAGDLAQGFAELLTTAGARVGALLPPLGSTELQTGLGWMLLGLGLLGAGFGLNRVLEEA
jgi:hypothetical protein